MGFLSRPPAAGKPVAGRNLPGAPLDMSPRPMGGNPTLTQQYLATATGPTRQPPVRADRSNLGRMVTYRPR